MKAFRWRLQKLLDLKQQQERAVRAELSALVGRIAALRRAIRRRRGYLRAVLRQIGAEDTARRLPRQELFLSCCNGGDPEIRRLGRRLAELERQHREKLQEARRRRQARRTLERLRQEAKVRYDRQWNAAEQRQLDESASIAYVHGRRRDAGPARQTS